MIVRPLKYKHFELNDYGVDSETGEIWSFKGKRRSLSPDKVAVFRRNADSYVGVCLSDNIFDAQATGRRNKSINAHQIVANTLLPLPIPNGVTKAEWKRTPESVKKACIEIWQINHKDHDRTNFRPDNLEYVTGCDNMQSALKHYSKEYGEGYSFKRGGYYVDVDMDATLEDRKKDKPLQEKLVIGKNPYSK
jgi:hypothetical protein